MLKKIFPFLLILLLPTYFIDNNNKHDWGDDFAQYINQANHLRDKTLPESKIINIEEYSSNKRGVLFSKILSFVPKTQQIKPYKNLIFIFFILSAVVVFLFFSTAFNPILCLLLTLCIFLNYHTLQLKATVMTEFVFVFLLYIIFILIEKPSKKSTAYLIPILFGILATIRIMTLFFLIAYLLYLFLGKEKTNKEKLYQTLKSILIFIVIVTGINLILLPGVENTEPSFFKNYSLSRLTFDSPLNSIHAYYTQFKLLFEQEVPYGINLIIIYSLLIFFIVGITVKIRSGIGFKEIAILIYLFFLVIFPYTSAGTRYLIPILPLILYYVVNGLLFVVCYCKTAQRYSQYFISVYFGLVILSNVKTICLYTRESQNEYGPYNKEIMADLNRVKNATKTNQTIAFSKPFIINLFCERNSYYYSEQNAELVNSKADYLLLPKNTKMEIYDFILNSKAKGNDTLELANFLLIKTKNL
jgi:hypothetical protein